MKNLKLFSVFILTILIGASCSKEDFAPSADENQSAALNAEKTLRAI